MGEAAKSVCPLCGREVAPGAGAPGAVVCACGTPFGVIIATAPPPKPPEKPEEKPFDPGPAIPPGVRSGLIEIHASIKEKRNPKGGRALCWDVLDQMLDYCRQTWPPPLRLRPPVPPLAKNALSGAATAAVSVTGTLTLGWKLGWTVDLGRTACESCHVSDQHLIGITLIALISMVLGAAVSVSGKIVLQFGRELVGAARGGHALPPPVRITRLQGLREQGVITHELFLWGKEVGLDEPPKLLPGDKPPAHPLPPPPPADHDGVRLLGTFVLAFADQVFEAPRKLDEARTGRWP
jgi:hypothetical protein